MTQKIGSALAQGINPADTERQKGFHQWKAATTSMLASMGPQDGRNDNTMDVVEDLEDMLEAFKPRLSRASLRQSLQDIIQKAIALDESFCGQQGWYALKYPEERHNIYVDQRYMTLVEGSSSSRRIVAFVIRPGLTRAGGVRGES